VAESETARTEAFSDGIFAIAITLLILDIRAPEGVRSSAELWRKLGGLWPGYVGYVTSFLIIGIMWSNHHLIFKHIKKLDHTLTMFNILLMMSIAFLPFSTSVLAHNIEDPATCVAATVFYSGTMLLTAIPFCMIWMHAVRAGLVGGPEAERARITRSFRWGWVSWLVTTLVAFVFPLLAMILIGVASLYWLIFPALRRRA
jgi:uncharacterized membrane protein